MPRSRYRIYDTHYPHFMTCTIVNWLPLFGNPPVAQIILDSWRFLQEHGRIELYAYVIMENHLHLIAAADDLAKEIGDFKSFTARQIVDLLQEQRAKHLLDQLACQKLAHKTDRQFQVWQEGSHPQMILDEAMMRQKAEYIHNNPVKKGYVNDPIHWRYPSAGNYAGLTGLLEVTLAW
jgi:REP-associated tyrosine transposase